MQTKQENRTGSAGRRHAMKLAKPALAILLIGGLLGILLLVFREQLTPAIQVETDKVIILADATDAESTAPNGDELLFQASGWIEPDPWPIKAVTLTDGFVSEVFFKEGEPVKKGQLLATLDRTQAELALQEAAADMDAAAARLSDAEDSWTRISALEEHHASASERIAAKNSLQEKQAMLKSAEAARKTAQLALDRTEIRAPADGIVLKRLVEPGSKRSMGMDDHDSAVIAVIFDPARLQVRVDVALQEAGRLFVGQHTRITTAMLTGAVFTGRVTRIVGEADLQRNTLQAKVEVHNPDPRLRPEVLCRVEFRGGPAKSAAQPGQDSNRSLWVPETALDGSSEAEQNVWVVDPLEKRAQKRAVMLGATRRNGYRLVKSGLRVNEDVVTSDTEKLKDGLRTASGSRESK